MKKIKLYILAFSLLSAGACTNDFLDTQMKTGSSEENFYKTTDDAYKALVGCYDGLQVVWASGISLPVAAEVMSDNTFGGTGNSDGFGYQMIDEFDKGRSPSDQDLFGDNWSAYYKAVYRCNMFIGKMDQIDWKGNTDLKNTYLAETRFLRAYLYFDMVRLWGNIPLLTAPSSENVPQASPEEVYKLIAEDLKFAADNLPAVAYGAQSVANHGRVTKYAAEALIGRVYLYYTGYYGKPDLAGVVAKVDALAYQEDIINNGGYGLVDKFEYLWPYSLNNYAGEDNKETIFAIKYTYTSDYNGNTDGNHWMVMNGIREQWSYPYGNGWGACTVDPKLWAAYSDKDTRRAGSIISIAGEGINFTNQSKQREYTGLYQKKYIPLVDAAGNSIAVSSGGVNFMVGQFQDYVSIRYADVLLMAAELGSSKAQKYFDDVRKRAYGSNFVSVAVNAANLLNERRLEFAGEGIRYWDLLRQGVDVAAATIAQTTDVLNGGIKTTKTINSANITTTKGLQQIPNTQITLSNGVLKQNAGW
ncbi:RagB/SusD family nutrient uptake outer membrane protein [Solitalea sp. MAHUQ-68]|uniref:RagB/SusD family nutrient uptake outer membrane protein n=1 Tax=Solitalea agri TaxID=2953739 RepID=A0A9X2EZZ2_9SPHI|nr:RagB/SusD family nutrient uptake outer membrane protein [Solitalea agri]MCO4291574.1 RagB/SusD family nutrient uptake outer membrane protein [Solitalea agri]